MWLHQDSRFVHQVPIAVQACRASPTWSSSLTAKIRQEHTEKEGRPGKGGCPREAPTGLWVQGPLGARLSCLFAWLSPPGAEQSLPFDPLGGHESARLAQDTDVGTRGHLAAITQQAPCQAAGVLPPARSHCLCTFASPRRPPAPEPMGTKDPNTPCQPQTPSAQSPFPAWLLTHVGRCCPRGTLPARPVSPSCQHDLRLREALR